MCQMVPHRTATPVSSVETTVTGNARRDRAAHGYPGIADHSAFTSC